jgi:hypothetical protein
MAQNNSLPWIVAIAAIAVIAFLVYQNHPGDAGGTLRDTITVSGTAELKVDPDKADLWLTVEASGNDASAAQAALQLKSNKVIDALKEAGVAESDMETTGFSVYPDYQWNPQTGENTIKGYKASHSIKVNVRDFTKVGTYADVAGGAGALVNNVQYGLTDAKKKAFDEQALAQAAASAKQKAESLTSSVGAKLGKVVAIQESNVYYPPMPYFDRMAIAEASGAGKATEILPGPQTVTATVTVTYALA